MSEQDKDPTPFCDSLWMRCLLAMYQVRTDEGAKELRFADVDAKVLEISRMPIEEMKQKLGI